MFKIRFYYKDRVGNIYKRIEHWNSLPTFSDKAGNLFVRNPEGMYRWDGKETNEDILPVEV